MASLITGYTIIYILMTALVFMAAACGFDADITNRSVIARIILWPFTFVIYTIIAMVWLCKHVWDTLILGFWDFIKSIPSIIKHL
jgi:hypothetical protein